MSDQALLPTFEAPVLKTGQVFFVCEIEPITVSVTVEGKKVVRENRVPFKGRHRSRIVVPRDRKQKMFIQNYPDPQTEQFENFIKEYAALTMRGRAPTIEPVALLVHAFLDIPESWSKRDKERARRGGISPTTKPDWDNFGKITDALNGIVWKDDSQVIDGRVIKRYSDEPGLRIEVREFLIDGIVK